MKSVHELTVMRKHTQKKKGVKPLLFSISSKKFQIHAHKALQYPFVILDGNIFGKNRVSTFMLNI